MTDKARSKIKRIATTLLEIHSLGTNYNPFIEVSESKLLIEADLDKDELKPLMEQLKEREIIENFAITEETFGNDYVIFFPDNFRGKAAVFINSLTSDPNEKINTDFSLYTEKKVEFKVDELTLYSDGTICFQNEPLQLKNQQHTLLLLFMRNRDRLLTYDDIKDNVIKSSRRDNTPNETIEKYVSALRKVLSDFYDKEVIVNSPKTGYTYSP